MAGNPLTFEALQTLDAIDRRGSFARAAEELGKATSAVSYVVQRLEEQSGVTLFQRQGRRSVLTEAGRQLVDEGRELLTAADSLIGRVKETASGWEPKLSIALESVMDSNVVMPLLRDFLSEHRGLEIDIFESVLAGGWEALEEGRADLLIGAPGPAPRQKGFRAISLGENEMVLCASPEHPASRETNNDAIRETLETSCQVVTHDTSRLGVHRSVNLLSRRDYFYV
ncbi:MAG: LysR family transcriptional regulator, partial [bacterium]